MIRAGTWHP